VGCQAARESARRPVTWCHHMKPKGKAARKSEKADDREPTKPEQSESKEEKAGEGRPGPPEMTVVGIGASAGGLPALKKFFSLMPKKTGLAYVVIVHLSPEHESQLVDLLQPQSKMPVMQVTKTVPLKPDRVYVIPPARNLSVIDTHLRLSNLEGQRGGRAPIDHFFRTLSKTHGSHAVGLILTGTGSDGSLGLRNIKEMGGLTIVQAPEEAEYDGMPRSAIATGMVDLVLRLDQMPSHILRFAGTEPHALG
jgi:two-component system, chemotaxis family, CheB/CheR fusion protein